MLRTTPRVEAVKAVTRRDTADGSPAELPVYLARPQDGGRRPGLLLLQEIFGVNDHIQDVAHRFAAAGYVVAAPDILYRTGAWQSYGYEQIAEILPLFTALQPEQILGDMRAALDLLAAQPDVDPARLGVVGYCFGGRQSLVAAERLNDRIKAAAIYYGGGIVSDQPAAPINRVADVRCPVVAFFGARDKNIPVAHVARLEQALTAAGVPNEVYCYPYADHGFFCDARASYHPRAAQDAWQRTLNFLATSLGPVPAVSWE